MSQSSRVTKSVSKGVSPADANPTHFTRLIESEKFNSTNMSVSSEEDDLDDLDFTSSPSPQPMPDIHLGDTWSAVQDVHLLNHERREDKMTILTQTTTDSATQQTIQKVEKVEKVEESKVEVDQVETKTKKKSTKKLKNEHISVELPSISKLKSVYSAVSGGCESVRPEMSSDKSGEARVFAKVCVANLRRSFGDLTNLALLGGGDATDRSSSGGDSWPSNSTAENKSHSLGELSNGTVRKLKSSFSKFDSLAKKAEGKREQTENKQTDGAEWKMCKSCNKEVFLVELIKAEKSGWHRNCFRCTTCSKHLNVDSYSSHEGKLYCKPHFKKLFEPKVVLMDEEENPSVEVIIRESQPSQLPADVARASESLGTGLEDINIDVRSKFEMFENFEKRQEEESVVGAEPIRRSGSVLKKMARYEGKEEGVGVPNDELNGDIEGEESSGGEDNDVIRKEVTRKLKNPATAMAEIMQCKQMEEVRNKWEEGMGRKGEESSEQRKAELNKFRSRLCQGKSNQLKEMYESGAGPVSDLKSEGSVTMGEIEALRLEKAKRLREMFEKGEVKNESGEEGEETETKSLVQRDKAVFCSNVAKQSRSLFKEMDENISRNVEPLPRQSSVNKKVFVVRDSSVGEVVKSGDKLEDLLPVKTEDLTSKFKFFETYEKELEERKRDDKRSFRMTPPPTDQHKESEEEVEAYRDPDVIRSLSTAPVEGDLIIQKSRTTSKMLNVFRQLEEASQVKESAGPRPLLKQFTPPREPARLLPPDDSEEEYESDNQEGEGEEEEGGVVDEQDAFLKEVGSLARARSLRARFEKWETDENARNNSGVSGCVGEESIESARNLRAKFEQIQLQQQQLRDANKPEVKVRRFVEIQNQPPSDMSEECAFCEKKVYAMEKLEANNKVYHKNCFRCSVCKAIMRMDSFTFHHGSLYCKNHFKQLFKIKGNYDEGFGHETQKQIFARKQAEKENN